MKNKEMVSMTEQEKQSQIKNEALATTGLFLFCMLWHVGFGFLLNNSGIYWLHIPLWWWVSTPGVFVIAVAGVLFLLKKVFKNFDLGKEEEEQ